ncbi:penicillin-binding transpeptidase domain-containing protein [Amycolatopsis sp. BJA-103]|uniref:penicillin-binding transpeptidase domain-containing protein n=1 Tax=unclassified Amycolatopsis TaxID=2618356 RepID=UPI000C785D03|nr:penicillin-binding transpeptidase domain-containing protein [Amycolatopsis sp. BJA-103]AUI60733.1 penicillin-binding protein [Amycolatopsis sp. BJA-103]PNE21981.1 penicillin-binding protein [Amycolatopsis sp. BJA-103]
MPARRRFAVVMLAGVVGLSASGCGLFADSGPDDAISGFLGGLSSGDVSAAAFFTDSPDAARASLEMTRKALSPESIKVADTKVQHASGADNGTATYQLTWNLPRGRAWTYKADAQVHSTQDGWKVRWLPTVLHPQLAAQQSITLKSEPPDLAPVLDRDGMPLLRPQTVVGVVLDPAKAGDLTAVSDKLGAVLGRFDASVTGQSIRDGVKALKPGSGYPVISLRANDYQQVKPEIYDLPGVRFGQQDRLLPDDKNFGKQVLPVVRTLVEDQVEGSAGWRVVTLDTGGGEIIDLHNEQPKPAPAVVSTLSVKAQGSAERALAPVPTASALVAIQPSTGELLAVAQNAPADPQGAISLTGRFPPGSTFKMATALAALSAGSVQASSPVDCPGTATFENRTVPNEGKFALGVVPLSTAFAKSCNTTFAKLSTELPPAALTDAARDLGIGADFVIPGLTTITGSAPPANTVAQRAENGFGQGTVVTSPFGMAVAAATVQAGKIPVPTLVRGLAATSSGLGKPIRPEVLDALRGMMREVVTDGTATLLKPLPEVRGKTGTAQFGDGTHAHGWFVGYTGDLAFAVLTTDAGTSRPAVEAAQRFLAGLG